MPIGKKIRIYDLARELKQDAKRVMEELRREGADVSVPSNSVSPELAEKIRLRYFPKAEVAPKRAIKVIKATKKEDAPPVVEEEQPASVEAPPLEMETAEPVSEPVAEAEPSDEPKSTTKPRSVYKLQKKPAAQVEASEAPAEVADTTAAEETGEADDLSLGDVETSTETVEAPAVKAATNRILRPSGTQIKQLTLTRDALEKGVKPGERVVSEAPTKTGKLLPDAQRKAQRSSRHAGRNGGTADDLYAACGQSPKAGTFRRAKGQRCKRKIRRTRSGHTTSSHYRRKSGRSGRKTRSR